MLCAQGALVCSSLCFSRSKCVWTSLILLTVMFPMLSDLGKLCCRACAQGQVLLVWNNTS